MYICLNFSALENLHCIISRVTRGTCFEISFSFFQYNKLKRNFDKFLLTMYSVEYTVHRFSLFLSSRQISLQKASRLHFSSRALETYCQQKYLAAWHYLKIDRQRVAVQDVASYVWPISRLNRAVLDKLASRFWVSSTDYFVNIFRYECYERDLFLPPRKKLIFLHLIMCRYYNNIVCCSRVM